MHVSVPETLKRVFQAYGFENPYQIIPNRHTWFVSCSNGRFFVKRSSVSLSHFAWIQACLEKIREKGYSNVLPYIHTKDGKRSLSEQGYKWYATPWIASRREPPDVDQLVQSLARFHRYAEQVIRGKNRKLPAIDQNWIQRWRRKKEEIIRQKEKVDQKEFPSPFDYSFSKHYPTIHHSLQFAIRGMEKFLKVENGKAPRYTICHNRIHPSNLVHDGENFYWVDFDHASLGSPVRDLALFIQRFSYQRSPKKLLALYEQEFPLLPKEKRLLAVYLAYPGRILKSVRRYDQDVKVSNEPIPQRQLEEEMEQLSAIQQLVVDLWPTRK